MIWENPYSDAPELGLSAVGAIGRPVARRPGIASITWRDRLEEDIWDMFSTEHKIVSWEMVDEELRRRRQAGQRIVMTNGCFDLLHPGHVASLQHARDQGDCLVVGLNSDASIRRLKGRDRPIVAQHDRASMISALECVDAVTLFEDDTPLGIVEAVRPDVLVKGEDYAGSTVVGRELVESGGGRVVLLPLLPGRSSTSLVERIRSGMVDDRDLRRDAGIDSPTCQH